VQDGEPESAASMMQVLGLYFVLFLLLVLHIDRNVCILRLTGRGCVQDGEQCIVRQHSIDMPA
jgi:hypothetical protein